MFLALARRLNPDLTQSGPQVFRMHPMQLSRFLEETWANRATAPETPPGLDIPGPLLVQEGTSGILPLIQPPPPNTLAPLLWEHLIYAYMVENTRAYEIFRRVLEEYVYGERLGTPPPETHLWLRTTEQLLYSAEPPLQVFTLTSHIRPDIRATRRNAYFRLFGMDLNHGTDDNRPYPYPRAAASNTDFVPMFEGLLREVWRAIENFTNTSGPRPTDDTAIANFAQHLDNMLSVRRLDGNLARDELLHTSAMAWLHLTVSFDSPVVVALEAEANSPEERLLKIGQRVGLPAHSRSGAYFRLAENTSLILRGIELAQFNSAGGAQTLYMPPPPPPAPPISSIMQEIIRDWSIVTGRDMKARAVEVAPPQPRPIRPPARPIAPPAPAAQGNGRARMTGETLPV